MHGALRSMGAALSCLATPRRLMLAPLVPALAVSVHFATVHSGDTLSRIAARQCGTSADWSGIYAANKHVIGGNPNLIMPGQKLRISCRRVHVPVPAQAFVHAPARQAVTTAASTSGGAAAGGHLNCSGLERLWEAAGGSPGSAFMAAEIAMAESGGNQFAHSPTNDFGYWQINASNGALATYDAFGNARAAVIISHNGGDWFPWTTYTSGAYAGRC